MNVLENIFISHRLVAQQEIERQNFRVRGSGGECCISAFSLSTNKERAFKKEVKYERTFSLFPNMKLGGNSEQPD
jgi:hypothetical protein